MNNTLKIVLIAIMISMWSIDLIILRICRENQHVCTGIHVFVGERLFTVGHYLYRETPRMKRINAQRMQKLCEMYDENHAKNVAISALYAPLSYAFWGIPAILGVSLLSDDYRTAIILFIILLFLCAYFDIWLSNAISKRHREVLQDYATVLTKMSLLINAGITAAESFKRVSVSGNGVLYMEMRQVTVNVANGMSYDYALANMVTRCGSKEVKKFISLYKQNLSKGGSEFPYLLSELADLAWEDRKNRAKAAGSNASQKLLIPVMLMFTGILLMIIIPAFNSLL